VPVIDILPDEAYAEDLPLLDAVISVVIPTKNAGAEFDTVLGRLNQQRGLKSMEIIVVDSGSTDETLLVAENQQAKTHHIDPASFNHGRTRNFGLSLTKGDFVLFMTQDAIPVGDNLVYHMARIMTSHGDVAAVTCRQIPRSDADLFYTWSMVNHYQALQMDRDRISGTDHPDALSPERLRSIAGIDNVCTLYRRSILEKYRFNPLPFGEDLDVGVRMIRDGHKLAFLASQAVIHSHNRPAFYCLKRSYLDTGCLHDIIGKPLESPYPRADQMIRDAVTVYEQVNGLVTDAVTPDDMRRLVASIENIPCRERSVAGDPELHTFMMCLKTAGLALASPSEQIFMVWLKGALSNFFTYLDHTGVVMDDRVMQEVKSSVYKVFATILGNLLAVHVRHGERLPAVEEALSVGV
jgi:glycosyltransferase involved in cell wall biosynthesis